MSRGAESKTQWLVVLFAWPIAVLVGWVVARLTHTDWPAAVFPFAWLGVLFWTLRTASH